MPKKRQSQTLYTKPQIPVHPSLSTSRSTPALPAAPQSVNERLRQLRHGRNVTASAMASAAAELAPSRTFVPPPQANPLTLRQPQGGLRLLRQERRVPGPAAPRSWLRRSVNGPGHSVHSPHDVFASSDRNDPMGQRWSRLCALPDLPLPSAGSLQHTALARMASKWDWHVVHDGEWLAILPTTLKSALVAYIAVYHESGVSQAELMMLLEEDGEDAGVRTVAGDSGLTHLIIGPSMGSRIKFKELGALLANPASGKWDLDDSLGVPDSWDTTEARGSDGSADSEHDLGSLDGLTLAPFPVRNPIPILLPNLTHLSLALASTPSTITSTSRSTPWSVSSTHSAQLWPSLLAPPFLSRLTGITHLSLAYWPRPTLTPNSPTAFVAHHTGLRVDYSASNYLSTHWGDFAEAAGMLRQLGRACTSLKWLGLEGCGEWIEALGYETKAIGGRTATGRGHWDDPRRGPASSATASRRGSEASRSSGLGGGGAQEDEEALSRRRSARSLPAIASFEALAYVHFPAQPLPEYLRHELDPNSWHGLGSLLAQSRHNPAPTDPSDSTTSESTKTPLSPVAIRAAADAWIKDEASFRRVRASVSRARQAAGTTALVWEGRERRVLAGWVEKCVQRDLAEREAAALGFLPGGVLR